ncbi:MAG: alkylhydroperoxidase like protein AhpD family [Gammaproteobacteria bacterium]|jgi:AhpD family alkylhydroperoxidase|nr:alkylhydroperoxidase like protein AhpD family [Gammaproteobacteria bacterium]
MMNSSNSMHETTRVLTKLNQELPDFMSHFSALANTATQEGALSAKTKALITLSFAIQAKSNECITYHVKNALKHEVSREELLEVLTIATYMGGGPALMMAEDALTIYDEMSTK